MRIQNFEDFTDFYRTLKIFMLKIVWLSSSTGLLTVSRFCSSLKIFSQNILFKANFNNPRNFISSKISHPTVTCVFSKIKVVNFIATRTQVCVNVVFYTHIHSQYCACIIYGHKLRTVVFSDSCRFDASVHVGLIAINRA